MNWIGILKWLLLLFVTASLGCSSSFKAERQKPPLYQLDEETDVALVHIDVPPWVDEKVIEHHPPEPIIGRALVEAFEDTALNIVDRTEMGVEIDIYGNTDPLIFDTATFVATVGQPYRYDATHGASAHGVRPITWEALEAPPDFELDSETGEIFWVPDEKGKVTVELAAHNELGTDTYRFEIDVRENETYPEPRPHRRPEISNFQRFSAQAPADIPLAIPEPLLLAVYVHRWDETMEDDGSDSLGPGLHTKVEQYNTDIVYSLWTRDGVEVDTRRVRRAARLDSGFRTFSVTPTLPHWYSDTWRHGRDTRPRSQTNRPAKMFHYTALANAMALAYPYHWRAESYSVTPRDAVGMEAGFERMDDGDWAGAREHFQAIAAEEAHRIGEMTAFHEKERQRKAAALFNEGLVAEFQGRDQEAYELFNQALEQSGGRNYIRLHRDRVITRLEDTVDLNPKVQSANQAFRQQQQMASPADLPPDEKPNIDQTDHPDTEH